jgi:hypothetical protein
MTFFAATDDEFDLIFPEGTDIAFIDEVYSRSDEHRWMLPQVCCIDGLNPQAIAVIGAGNLGFPKQQRQAQDVLSVHEDRWNVTHQ